MHVRCKYIAVGSAPYFFENVVVQCAEDPGVALASELQAGQGATSVSPSGSPAARPEQSSIPTGSSPSSPSRSPSPAASGSSTSGGGMPHWLGAVVGISVAAGIVLAATFAVIIVRRRRRQRKRRDALQLAADSSSKHGAIVVAGAAPVPVNSIKLEKMESGEQDAAAGASTVGGQLPTAGLDWPETLWRSR